MTSGLENQAPAKNGTSTPTVMLKGIFEPVAEGQNVSKKQAQNLLAGMVETMTEHPKRGDRIRINGLGTLEEFGHRRDDADRRQQKGRVPQCAHREHLCRCKYLESFAARPCWHMQARVRLWPLN
jgi:nucleoid DNA-binding protein